MERSRWVAAGVGASAAAGALVLLVLGGVVWTIGPHVRDDRALDGAVRVVALTWAEAGRAAAEEQLAFELDAAGLGDAVPNDACALHEDAELRTARCAWSVRLELPGGFVLPLGFASEAVIDADGRFR